MRRTRSSHVGRSVLSGATTPNRNGLVMSGLLSFRSVQRNRRRIHPKFIGAAEIVYTLPRTSRTRHERALGPPGRLDRKRTPHAPSAAKPAASADAPA